MNSGPLLFLGIFVTLASSFWGLLLMPQVKIGRQELLNTNGMIYPARPGVAKQGEQVYRSLGCAECHTRQVRPRGYGSDFERGWGKRRTVAQDYLYDYPVMLGNLRTGPDLANIGGRQTNVIWQLAHLYIPKRMSPGSMMPPYRFLFENRKLKAGEKPPPEALPFELEPGYATIPNEEAQALVAYLLSQQAESPLFEAPLPGAATNVPPADVASTNTVSTNVISTNVVSTNLLSTAATNVASTNVTTNVPPPTPKK
jgi:cytochrome c oxidase cbb3-type subunit 2